GNGYSLYEGEKPANLTKYAGQYSTEMYTDRVVELINQRSVHHKSADGNETKPWLIYFAQQSVHAGHSEDGEVLEESAKYRGQFHYIKDERRRVWAGMVASLDESVARVVKALNDSGQLDDTLILFSTDNGGTAPGKNGHHVDSSMGSNWPLKGAKYT